VLDDEEIVEEEVEDDEEYNDAEGEYDQDEYYDGEDDEEEDEEEEEEEPGVELVNEFIEDYSDLEDGMLCATAFLSTNRLIAYTARVIYSRRPRR
jgi:hypothetical protein